VFDALTHRRHYKAAFPQGRAERLIAAGRGTQFDPDLTDLFLSPPVQTELRAAVRTVATYKASPTREHTRFRRGAVAPRPDVPEIAFRWHAERAD
jgi:HD-GYP domain-containing protein (c-di-GMP phosphodiesterase class II)